MIAQEIYNKLTKRIHNDVIDTEVFLDYISNWMTILKKKMNKFPEKLIFSKQTILQADFIASTDKEFVLNVDLDSIEKVEYKLTAPFNMEFFEERYIKIPMTTFDEEFRTEEWLRWYRDRDSIYFRWDKYLFDNFKTDIIIHYLPKINPISSMTTTIPYEDSLAKLLVEWCMYEYYKDENSESTLRTAWIYKQDFDEKLRDYIASIEITREDIKIQLWDYSKYTQDPWLYV